MPGVFALIGWSWKFFLKQRALLHVLLWLLTPSLFGLATLTRVMSPPMRFETMLAPYEGVLPPTFQSFLLIAPVLLFLMLLHLLGHATVLIAGRRVLQHRAGRSRTSFQALRREGTAFLVPLLLTEILRDCFTLLWGLLLIIPGVIYAVRTSFYDVVIITEEGNYREALRQSRNMVRGFTGKIFLRFLLLQILLFGPISVLALQTEDLAIRFDPRFLPVHDLVLSFLYGLAVMLFLLCKVELFGALKKLPRSVKPMLHS